MVDRPEQEAETEKQHDRSADDQRSRPRGRVVEWPRQCDVDWRRFSPIGGDDDRHVRRNLDRHGEVVVFDEVVEPQVGTIRVRHLGLGSPGQRRRQLTGLLVEADGGVAGVADPRQHIGRATVCGEHRAGPLHRESLTALERVEGVTVDHGHRRLGRDHCAERDLVGLGEDRALGDACDDHDRGHDKTDYCENKPHELLLSCCPAGSLRAGTLRRWVVGRSH